MPRPLPEIGLLTAFAALYQSRSFTQAARNLGVTQSALSHRIRKLEDYLGYRLFERSTVRVEPTQAGEVLLKGLEPILAGLEQLFRQDEPAADEVLQIEMESSFARNWLTPRLTRFTDRYPGIRIDLRIRNEGYQFARGTSLAIRWGEGIWPGYRAQRLMGMAFTPMCAPGYLDRHPLPDPSALLDRVLLHDRDTLHWAQWLRLAGVSGRPRHEGHVLHDTALLEHAVSRGQGVALLPQAFLPEDGDLVRPFPEVMLCPAEGYYILCPEQRPREAAARFAQWLLDEAALDAGNSN